MRGYAPIPGDSDLLEGQVSAITDKRSTSSTRSNTRSMTTRKPHYAVTDTGDLSDQLDQAQRRWPKISDRKELSLKLAAAGRDALEEEATNRASAVEETAGAISGVYEPGELGRLGEDWPE
jgi:hypothetical protein